MDVRSRDVRTSNGQLVVTVADLAATRSVTSEEARLDPPERRQAPAARPLVADAHRAHWRPVCRSKAEGGQRCFGSAADAYQQTLDRYEAAPGGDLTDLAHAASKLTDAEVTFASTASGFQNLATLAAASDARGDHRYHRALTRGLTRRAANDAAYRRAIGGPPTDPAQWAAARGDRCRVCGQFTAITHRCPTLSTTPAAAPSTPDIAAAHHSSVITGQFLDIELTGSAAARFEDRYGSHANPDVALADAVNDLIAPFHVEVLSGGLEP